MAPRQGGALVHVTGGLVVAAGGAFALVRFFGVVPPGQDIEAAVGAVAFGAVIAAPGVLALLSVKGRPALLLPAAVLLVPLSFLSFALVTLPLLVPAALLVRRFAQAPVWATSRAAVVTPAVLVLLLAALFALFGHDDPREYTTATASYGTSDVVTYAESALSLSLTLLAVSVGWRFGGPPPRDAVVG